MTRDEIFNLKVGDVLEQTLDVKPFTDLAELYPNAVWGFKTPITKVAVKILSDGKACAVGERFTLTYNGAITFCIIEGQNDYRIVKQNGL